MSADTEFRIVFEKLAEHEERAGEGDIDDTLAEAEGIRELQRLCAALSAPPTRFYTGT